MAAFNFGTGDPNEAYHQYWPLDPAAAEELSEWAGQALQEVDYVFESTEADG